MTAFSVIPMEAVPNAVFKISEFSRMPLNVVSLFLVTLTIKYKSAFSAQRVAQPAVH